jgi:hypothetical protein
MIIIIFFWGGGGWQQLPTKDQEILLRSTNNKPTYTYPNIQTKLTGTLPIYVLPCILHDT